MKRLFIILVLHFSFYYTYAQFSIIQDGDGETSFLLFQKNAISINANQTSIGFSIRPQKLITNKQAKYWTITSSAKAKEGSGSIFKGGRFQFSGKLGANIIFDKTKYHQNNTTIAVIEPKYIYHFIGFEVLYSRHNVFDSTLTFDNQIFDQTNVGARLNIGWNLENVTISNPFLEKLLGTFTSGISGSIGIKDNTDIINQDEIITSTQSFIQGTILRTISSTNKAYDKNTLSTHDLFARINVDFAKHLFNHRILANLHLTYAFDQNLQPIVNPALGLFLTPKGAPLEAIVGIQIQTQDWGNNRGSKKNRWERTAIVLTAGFPFD